MGEAGGVDSPHLTVELGDITLPRWVSILPVNKHELAVTLPGSNVE